MSVCLIKHYPRCYWDVCYSALRWSPPDAQWQWGSYQLIVSFISKATGTFQIFEWWINTLKSLLSGCKRLLIPSFFFFCRAFWRVSASPGWFRAVAAQQTTSVRSSRRTSRGASAAFRRSTVWAKRLCWAPGSPSTTPSTGGMRTCGVSHSVHTSARCQSSSSARSSCMRCSSRSSASASLSTSCCTTPARWAFIFKGTLWQVDKVPHLNLCVSGPSLWRSAVVYSGVSSWLQFLYMCLRPDWESTCHLPFYYNIVESKYSLWYCFLFPCSYFSFFPFWVQEVKAADHWSFWKLTSLNFRPHRLFIRPDISFILIALIKNNCNYEHKYSEFPEFLWGQTTSLATDSAEHHEGLGVSAHCCSVIGRPVKRRSEVHPQLLYFHV